jgi:hypothetical protein
VTFVTDQLAPDPNDPLQILLKELGDVPRPFGEEERDIQLTLENRFKSNIGTNQIISQY